MSSKTIIPAFICLTTTMIGSISWAQDNVEPDIMDDLQKCQLIQKDKERLMCYDQAMPMLRSAIETKDILVLNKSEIAEAQEDSFGKNEDGDVQLKKIIEKEEIADTAKAPKELVSPILKTERNNRNGLRFYLENGQIWDQTDSSFISVNKKKQNSAVIKKAAFGSFRLRVNGKGTPVRVKRIK